MSDKDLVSTDFATLRTRDYTQQRQLDWIRDRMVERLYCATGVFAVVYSVALM
ncbi:MAG: hypothetical protein ABI212_08380 [Burkholderiaceae bacterium]